MRSFLIAVLMLVVAAQLQAQDSLPRFVFEGHSIGDARPKAEPSNQCSWPGEHKEVVCMREKLDGVSFEAAYTYSSAGNLVGVGALVDSVEFNPLLSALTKRYGQPRAMRSGTGHAYAQWRFREGKLHLTRTGTLVVLRFAGAS